MPSWKPEGYNSASPYLVCSNARATLQFLQAAFNAERLRVMTRDDGRIMHGEARIDDTVVMLSDAAEGWPAVPSHVHIYVADVDTAHASALAAGAKSVMVPVQKDDADKRGGVIDPGGTTWWLATQVG
jgi:PhnB protein